MTQKRKPASDAPQPPLKVTSRPQDFEDDEADFLDWMERDAERRLTDAGDKTGDDSSEQARGR